uniref:ethanolamine kinase n=1 Tax=Gopherus agassizii TaxID=38772 RepID=A0A452H0M4_9SAUR
MILPSFYIVCFIRSQSTFPRRSISLAPFHRWENWAVPYPSRLGIELGLEGKWSLFTDGITNKLMACYMDEGMADAVLVRVYGRKTELFVDRENELKNFQVLRAHGCAPNLYCTFQNGLCYEFMQGTALGPEHVQQPQIFRFQGLGKDKILRALVEFRSLFESQKCREGKPHELKMQGKKGEHLNQTAEH